jgi:hypothetical protein
MSAAVPLRVRWPSDVKRAQAFCEALPTHWAVQLLPANSIRLISEIAGNDGDDVEQLGRLMLPALYTALSLPYSCVYTPSFFAVYSIDS